MRVGGGVTSSLKPASLWREGVANAKIANAANIKEGPRSCAGQHQLQDQECCQAPPRARSLPGPGYWGGSSVYRGGENLGMEGPEDSGGEGQLAREPGCPGGDQFFPREDLCKLLVVLDFTFTFQGESGR